MLSEHFVISAALRGEWRECRGVMYFGSWLAEASRDRILRDLSK